jgi:hypothetical protein
MAMTAVRTRPYLPAIGVFLLVRLCGVVILGILADNHHKLLFDLLKAWDGDWYLSIAENGYADVPDRFVDAAGKHTPVTSLAFFPAYPTLVRLFALFTGTDTIAAALLVNVVAGCLAACAIVRIGRIIDPRPNVGLLLVALWAGAPMAITLSMTYTESLFTALAAWALVGVLEQRWISAGLCCAGAGLVRPTASVLVAIVGVAAIIAVVQGRNRWPALACVLLCPAGFVGYLAYVGSRTGSLTGWFDIERDGWFSEFDGGAETIKFVGDVLVSGNSVMEIMNVLTVIAATILAILSGLSRIPWPLVAYGAGIVIMVAGSAGIAYAKTRFLIPGFTLLIPIALGLANRRPQTTIAVAAGFVLLGGWLSAYSLTGWQYAI